MSYMTLVIIFNNLIVDYLTMNVFCLFLDILISGRLSWLNKVK